MTDNELRMLLDHCKPSGLHENGGFGYSVEDFRWGSQDDIYHYLIIYPADNAILVETWNKYGDEPESSRKMEDPALLDVFSEMQEQARQTLYVLVKDQKFWTESGTWGSLSEAKTYTTSPWHSGDINSIIYYHGGTERDFTIKQLKYVEGE